MYDDKAFWEKIQYHYGNIRACIESSGSLFGEKALLESKARAATVITNKPS